MCKKNLVSANIYEPLGCTLESAVNVMYTVSLLK